MLPVVDSQRDPSHGTSGGDDDPLQLTGDVRAKLECRPIAEILPDPRQRKGSQRLVALSRRLVSPSEDQLRVVRGRASDRDGAAHCPCLTSLHAAPGLQSFADNSNRPLTAGRHSPAAGGAPNRLCHQ